MKDEELTKQFDSKMVQCIRKIPKLVIPRITDEGDLTQEMIKTLKKLVDIFCNTGYIRTHAFLSSWIKDFTTTGLLKEKEIHEVVDSSYWGWDQTNKYLDFLKKSDYIIFGRNTDKMKICRLNFSPNTNCSLELQRLLTYYSKFYRANELNENFCEEALLRYRNCIRKSYNFENVERNFAQKSNRIAQATDDELSILFEELISAYSGIYEEDSQNPTTRLTKVLVEHPLLFRGLKMER
ncbi:MAG: hypothetical protein JJE41_13175 [Candidatus Heimdallarchaeota archaeon]|nr:hypothetical protein [Candidatus Heimdallarchaeota archaeon]